MTTEDQLSESDRDDSPAVATLRTAEIVVAMLFLAAAAIFIFDARRVGIGWLEGQGPATGYFPFYIAVMMAIASTINLIKAVIGKGARLGESFTTVTAFGRVLTVLLPAAAFVLLIGGLDVGPLTIPGLGIYVASAIFIAFFMLMFGGEGLLRSLVVAIAVPLFFFVVFERWFLVPLPKGPLEALLGLA